MESASVKAQLFLGIACIFCVSLCHYYFLRGEKFLPGTDAYYYALQSESLYETGATKIPDHSPVHWLNAGIRHLTQNPETPILATWILLALFLRLGALSLALGSGLNLIFAWALCSPSLLILVQEFPRQAVSFLFLASGLIALRSPRQKIKYSAALWLGLAVWAHTSQILLAPLLGALYIRDQWPWPQRKIFLIAIPILLAVGAAFLLQRKFFSHVQLALPGVWTLLRDPRWGLALRCEWFLAFLGLIFLHRQWALALAAAIGCIPAFLPYFNESAMSLGERSALVFPIALLFALGATRIDSKRNAPAAYLKRGFLVHGTWLSATALSGAFTLLLAPKFFSALEESTAVYESVRQELSQGPKPKMLITHFGLNYYLKEKLKIETFPYEPEKHWDAQKVWRIVRGIDLGAWRGHSEPDCQSQERFRALFTPGYALVREDCYQRFRSRVQLDSDEILYRTVWNQSLNPHEKRPAWLYGKYKNEKAEEFPARPGA